MSAQVTSRDIKMNGVNGINGGPPSSITSSPSAKRYSLRSSSMNSNGMTVSNSNLVRNTVQSLEKKSSAELGFGVLESISETTFIDLVQYIAQERLSSLPHKGGKWDKVLIRSLYFAEQQHAFEKMMKGFGADDSSAASLGYGFCKILLELGHENAAALEKAFAILYKHSLEIAALLHRTEVVTTTPQIREQLCLMYGDLLTLTSSVATRYYKTVHGMASSNSLDIHEAFGPVIESFRSRQQEITDLVWNHQAQMEGVNMEEGGSAKVLKRWLGPNDSVLSTLSQDHTSHLGGQAEHTCLWFQKPLSNFIHGQSKVMAVTGSAGSGKSVLAASVAERLQRPVGRQTFSTLFHCISGAMPSAATPISVLKSLLAQMFSLRLGNMQMYHAISQAYERCKSCSDLTTYENHLWTALGEALKKPLENARDLVIVVDGLDELQGGKSATQAFFERLAETVGDGKRVKLIGVAQTISMPSGVDTTQIATTSENVKADIREVVLKNMIHCRHLTSRPGPEQEQVLNRITRTANDSFVWANLASEIASEQKSPEEFTKMVDTLESSKPSVGDLVQRILSMQELSPVTKTVLSFIVYAERPFSFSDIRRLLSVGTQDANKSVEEPDVPTILQSLESLLHLSDGIARFKHQDITSAVHTLVDSGKFPMPAETKQMDLVTRTLNYFRITFRDEIDPTIDEYDPEVLEKSLQEHPILSYILRFWTVSISRVPDQKRPKDLSNILPSSATLPQMETALWTQELPLPRTLELSTTSLKIRQTTFKEVSPAVLQSNINTAVVYENLGRPDEAAPLYYWAIKTSQSLLSNYHPLPVELGYSYLRTSMGSVQKSRNETMTRREDVLKVLITLLEYQYGKSSSHVIQIRTQLAQFYEFIHEEHNATEIYQTLQGTAEQVHGKDSSQARDASDRLKVTFGRSTQDRKIDTRQESIFDEDDEAEQEETLDITAITRRLSTAKTEQDYVFLWQRLSEICRHTANLEYHEKNIDVAMSYSKFLVAQKRSNEAAAILSSVSREYESNQVSFSDRIVARLSDTATYMREIGQYTAALSILKRTSHVYQSLKREDSHQFTEIQRQILTVTSELVEKSGSEVHGDALEDIFRASIKNESRPVDAKLMALGKKLIVQHMDQSKITEAIELIHLTLHRTWPDFLSLGSSEVEMTKSFPKESIELIEFLSQCYTRQRRPENAESTLEKLFHATLTPTPIDFTLLTKVQTLLIEHYDKHNHPLKAISILQKSLPARRTNLGPTDESTIKTLYDLGQRSRSKARMYPFWIDYFQQIVTYLNKDADTCHPKALDAAIIVANSYWEDGRYPDAVPVFSVLWTTFVQKTKEHPQFSQVDFVQTFYTRYYQCLEQIGTRFDVLYQVTSQYKSTCSTIFGAQAAVTVNATLSLARICYSSDRHMEEALTHYEEASKHSTDKSETKSEIKHALTTIYTRQIIIASSTSNVKAETIERARARSVEQYESSASQLGYAHQSTLQQLHDVCTLYFKQKKTDAITKELTKATTEVISKETSSVKMIEAAETIVKTFQATSTVEYSSKLLDELHKQVVSKDASNASSFGFDLTKYGRPVLPFIAAMEYRLSTDKTVSFSQLMADLTMETLSYEEYRTLIKSNASLQAILLAASKLRVFLVRIKRDHQVNHLDQEVASIFVARDGAKIKLVSKSSARIFMQAIMEYLGTHPNTNFMKAIIVSSNMRLEQLMKAESYTEAYDIGHCAYEFAVENEGYSGSKGISYGFNLASDLAGIGFPSKCRDESLRSHMLHLSNDIAKRIIEVCKKQNINFAEIKLDELNRLVLLLGEQEDYQTLEWVLTTLWTTREEQRTWSAESIHHLGKRLICARYLAGHPVKALRLCEDITYNLKRAHGADHPTTEDMNVLLAQLYTSVGNWYLQNGGKDKDNMDLANQYFAKAVAVHEESLRVVVDGADGVMDDDDDEDSAGQILAQHGISLTPAYSHGHDTTDNGATARTHLRLLKLAYQRLGSWPKSHSEYEHLVNQVKQSYPAETKDVPGLDKWSVKGFGGGKAESNEGAFEKQSWHLVDA